MRTSSNNRSHVLLAILVLVGIALVATAVSASERTAADRITGTWYIALNVEPFGLPAGTKMPGLAVFNRDGTVQFVDGGDFGGLPFTTRDLPQTGSWTPRPGGAEAVLLSLQADDITGEVLSWQKLHLRLFVDGRNRLLAIGQASTLACDQPAPFPIFGCPDPIASADDFVPVNSFDLEVELTRLLVPSTP